MTTLAIEGLRASAGGTEILHGVDLTVSSGEVHAVMGPNGAGKSTLSGVVMGKPGYEVRAGSVTLDGEDVLAMEPWERAAAGLFLGTAFRILERLRLPTPAQTILACAFLGVGMLRWPLLLVVAALATISVALAWRWRW